MKLIGIDTGGTFTDFVLWHDGGVRVHKVLSTPEAPERAILQGIAELGLESDGLKVVHGSTVATNAALEGKGVRTAYVANRGLGDLLTIGRQARQDLYDLQPPPRHPPVPGVLCLETGGRLGSDGTWVEPLTERDIAELRSAVERVRPQAVAINLLFSYLDDGAERALAEALPEGLFISRSSEVLPVMGEYERGIATWLNAWVGPLVALYIERLCGGLPGARVAVMQSSGEAVAAEQTSGQAVRLLLSGPAGGLLGASFVGRLAARLESQSEMAVIETHRRPAGRVPAGPGVRRLPGRVPPVERGREGHEPTPSGSALRLLTFDMGGTSTDVALVDGEPRLTTEGRIAGYPVAVPMVDMHTIGAGGGSIARLDAGGVLLVGPESAGADPGPVCYGKGGGEPTVTDANLVLGRLRADAFLGGRMSLDLDAARDALRRLGGAMGVDEEEAALGIVRVANEHMARALRVISVQRGLDPRDYVLTSFGGAGGLHVCALAEGLGMHRAMVPIHAGVLSALGMLVTPPGRLLTRTWLGPLSSRSDAQIRMRLGGLAHEGITALLREGVAREDMITRFSLDLRYLGQSYTLNLPWQGVEATREAFHRFHLERYGHRLDLPVEMVNLRARVTTAPPTLSLSLRGETSSAARSNPATALRLDDAVPVLKRRDLGAGDEVRGPAVVIDEVATTWLARGWVAWLDRLGNLQLKW